MSTDLQTNITSTNAFFQLLQNLDEYKNIVKTLEKIFNDADDNGKKQILQHIPYFIAYLDIRYANSNHTLQYLRNAN